MEKHYNRVKNGLVPFLIIGVSVFFYLVLSTIKDFNETNLAIFLLATTLKIITIPIAIYLVGFWLERNNAKPVIEN